MIQIIWLITIQNFNCLTALIWNDLIGESFVLILYPPKNQNTVPALEPSPEYCFMYNEYPTEKESGSSIIIEWITAMPNTTIDTFYILSNCQ